MGGGENYYCLCGPFIVNMHVKIFHFQCFSSGCLLTRGALSDHDRLTKSYCTHLQQAREAQVTRTFASVVALDLEKVLLKVTDNNLEKELKNESSDGEVFIFKLPGENLAVPLLGSEKTKLDTNYVHLRDKKCNSESCTKLKSKLHTLVVKGIPVCRHVLLGMY